jgi:hypothetical protein
MGLGLDSETKAEILLVEGVMGDGEGVTMGSLSGEGEVVSDFHWS